MIEAIEKKHWNNIADILQDCMNKQGSFPVELIKDGPIRWFSTIIKQPLSYYFDKGVIVTKNLVSTLISDDPDSDPTRLEVFYYCIPYSIDVEVEYKARLAAAFPDKSIVFHNISNGTEQINFTSIEVESEGDEESSELGIPSFGTECDESTTNPVFGLK